MDNDSVMAMHLSQYVVGGDIASNADYVGGAGQSFSDELSRAATGRVGLGILSLAILGVMFLYVSTRSRQL